MFVFLITLMRGVLQHLVLIAPYGWCEPVDGQAHEALQAYRVLQAARTLLAWQQGPVVVSCVIGCAAVWSTGLVFKDVTGLRIMGVPSGSRHFQVQQCVALFRCSR